MILGTIIVLLIFLISLTYRNYIYRNHINDLHFADTFSNLLSLPAGTLFFWGLNKGKKNYINIVLNILIILTIYEFVLSGTFDILDIFASILSGGIMIVFYFAYKKYRINIRIHKDEL